MTATILPFQRFRLADGPIVEFNRPQRIAEMVKVVIDQGAHGSLADVITALRDSDRFDRIDIAVLAFDVWETAREEATVAEVMGAP